MISVLLVGAISLQPVFSAMIQHPFSPIATFAHPLPRGVSPLLAKVPYWEKAARIWIPMLTYW